MVGYLRDLEKLCAGTGFNYIVLKNIYGRSKYSEISPKIAIGRSDDAFSWIAFVILLSTLRLLISIIVFLVYFCPSTCN